MQFPTTRTATRAGAAVIAAAGSLTTVQSAIAQEATPAGGALTVPPLTFQAPAAEAPSGGATQPTYLLSKERLHEDREIGWAGFLSGLRGFEQFYDPVGQPIYFESPLVNTSVRLLFLHHEFPEKSQLQGGHVDVLAAQARIAVTERLAIIATKDGYSWLDAGALPEDEGWNDIALGVKYAFWVDREREFVMTGGLRWQWGNGDGEVLQGLSPELSPFISVAKGWDKFHTIANLTYRLPIDSDEGNDILQWDVHLDYELFKGFAPLVELHGLHYLDDGDRLPPLTVGGLDYANIGSGDVSGTDVIWLGVGARFKFSPHFSLGATYEFSLTNRNVDIMDDRVTVDFTITW
jgi:hypothetical protein